MKSSYTPDVGATIVRNPHYWGTKALPATVEFTFYRQQAPMTAALEAGSIDCLRPVLRRDEPAAAGRGLQRHQPEGEPRTGSSRCAATSTPFTNKYVRQAIAYTLDRPAIVRGARSRATPRSATTAPSPRSSPRPTRASPSATQNLTLAKQLLAKAGVPNGFSTPLLTETTQEMPDFAQIIKESAAKIGVDISLTIETPTKYYGSAVFGTSDWLDGEMSLVDYGARSVPNVYLEAPLQSDQLQDRPRFLERRPLQQLRRTTRFRSSSSPPLTSPPSASSPGKIETTPARTRRRSSSPTSTTT